MNMRMKVQFSVIRMQCHGHGKCHTNSLSVPATQVKKIEYTVS